MHSLLDKPENLACYELITILEDCHARGFLWKSMGMCNDSKRKVNECLYAERLKRASKNRDVARARRERIKKTEEELGL